MRYLRSRLIGVEKIEEAGETKDEEGDSTG